MDSVALEGWLRRAGLLAEGEAVRVTPFRSGFSNRTDRVDVVAAVAPPADRATDAGGVVRSLVLRRPPPGVAGGVAHDMVREHGLLAALHPAGLPVPAPLGVCADAAVLGAPFHVMAHVDGVILRGARPAEVAALGGAAPAMLQALSRTFAATLARLHAVPVHSGPLAALGRGDGYVQRQVAGWTKRWAASRTHEVPAMERVAAGLARRLPPEQPAALVHNDFKFDNLVLRRDDLSRVEAILDWEMATVGDPLLDLGTALAYWVEAGDPPLLRTLGLGVTAQPGAATRAELVAAYAAASARDPDAMRDVAWYHAFGLFKVAVIAQQLHARHVRGLAADPRFGRLGEVVEVMAGMAVEVLDGG
jgi:aminoglycoside phosphotransferase (APT) family kinase protein